MRWPMNSGPDDIYFLGKIFVDLAVVLVLNYVIYLNLIGWLGKGW